MFNSVSNLGGYIPNNFTNEYARPLSRLSEAYNEEMTVGRGNGPGGVCLKCKGRRYQDVSSDSGVSFQSPTYISPEQSFSAVRAHEHEHIRRDRAAAVARGDEVVHQNVTYRVAACPECGKTYKAGGTATTVTRSTQDSRPEPYGDFVDEYV